MTSAMSFVLPAPNGLPADAPKIHPAEMAGTDKELLAALTKVVEANTELIESLLKKRSEQVLAIEKVEALALSASPFVNRTGGCAVLRLRGADPEGVVRRGHPLRGGDLRVETEEDECGGDRAGRGREVPGEGEGVHRLARRGILV